MGLRVWGGDRVSSAWPPGPPSELSAFGLGSGAEWTGRCAQPQRSCRDSQRNLAWGWEVGVVLNLPIQVCLGVDLLGNTLRWHLWLWSPTP